MLRGGLSLGRQLASKQGPAIRHLNLRRYATAPTQLPLPGDKLHGFTVQRAKAVPELELAAIHLSHDKTGAEYIHVAREDRNNVFAAGFKTNPNDDTGVPHILEHTTLCGSEKCVLLLLLLYLRIGSVTDCLFAQVSRQRPVFQNAESQSIVCSNIPIYSTVLIPPSPPKELHECLHLQRPHYLPLRHHKPN